MIASDRIQFVTATHFKRNAIARKRYRCRGQWPWPCVIVFMSVWRCVLYIGRHAFIQTSTAMLYERIVEILWYKTYVKVMHYTRTSRDDLLMQDVSWTLILSWEQANQRQSRVSHDFVLLGEKNSQCETSIVKCLINVSQDITAHFRATF